MRMIRSFFFGGFAFLAAAMFLSAPASAIDYEPGLYSHSMDWPDVAIRYVDVAEASIFNREYVPKPGQNAHAVVYASQNQPLAEWRFAVDAYSRIDPHILAG